MPPGNTAGLQPPAGDEVPATAARFIRGLSDGQAEHAALAFAADALYAVPAVEDDEVAPRAVHMGADIEAALAAETYLGHPHQIRLCCAAGDDCLLEGWILGPGAERIRSFAASLQLDGDGLIARCLLFRTPAVEDAAGAGNENSSGADIRHLLDEYFEELHAARFEAATANYSHDCLYSHPPYFPGTPRADFRGLAELLAGFEARGLRPARNFIDHSIQRGADLMLEGHSLHDGTAEGQQSSFVSSATVDAAGKICRYVAFQCKERVPRFEPAR